VEADEVEVTTLAEAEELGQPVRRPQHA
jgi:hypothetical protein